MYLVQLQQGHFNIPNMVSQCRQDSGAEDQLLLLIQVLEEQQPERY